MSFWTAWAAAGIALAGTAQADAPAPIAPGTVAIERPASDKPRPAADQIFADAVEESLADAGFTAFPDPDHARYVASVSVTRVAKGEVMAKGKSGGANAAPGVGGAALGGIISVPLSSPGARVGQLVSTTLEVRIRRRGESQPLWEGRAVTQQVAGSQGDAPGTISTKLARTLFRNFPGQSGLVVSVP
jgi:hypothetical protein